MWQRWVSRSRNAVVHDPETRAVSDVVTDAYGYAEMQIVSFEDLFGGKLHAAIDRQHPRGLYDVKLLYEHEGPTDDLFRTFPVYIACSPRPAHELLNPNLMDLNQPYVREFEGTPLIYSGPLSTRMPSGFPRQPIIWFSALTARSAGSESPPQWQAPHG